MGTIPTDKNPKIDQKRQVGVNLDDLEELLTRFETSDSLEWLRYETLRRAKRRDSLFIQVSSPSKGDAIAVRNTLPLILGTQGYSEFGMETVGNTALMICE